MPQSHARSLRLLLLAVPLAPAIIFACNSAGTMAVPTEGYDPLPTTVPQTDSSVADAGDAAMEGAAVDSGVPVAPDGAPLPTYCALPGSVVWNNGAPTVVPGAEMLPEGGTPPDLTWVHLPDGFCAHYYATVPETRQLRFAPNGDLFVASPSYPCSGGGNGGFGWIAVVPDDDHDGVGDAVLPYMSGIPQVQGLLFHSTNGYFYYQNATTILRTPYNSGDRTPSGNAEQVADISGPSIYTSGDHWQKVIDEDDNGNLFVTNGGDQGTACEMSSGTTYTPQLKQPFQGGIYQIDSTPSGGHPNGIPVADGLRNPIALRCKKGTGTCFGLELAKDFDPQGLSREKLYPIRMGDNWGFPCCATANQPYTDISPPVPASACAGVATETTSFIIDHTPFGLDFEQGLWPGMWAKRTFVVLHGYFGSWIGARVVAIESNPATGWPVPSNEADAGTVFSDFATGWDDGFLDHGRPAAVAFAPDGRLFVGQDIGSAPPADPRLNGLVFWIAPVQTVRPSP